MGFQRLLPVGWLGCLRLAVARPVLLPLHPVLKLGYVTSKAVQALPACTTAIRPCSGSVEQRLLAPCSAGCSHGDCTSQRCLAGPQSGSSRMGTAFSQLCRHAPWLGRTGQIAAAKRTSAAGGLAAAAAKPSAAALGGVSAFGEVTAFGEVSDLDLGL